MGKPSDKNDKTQLLSDSQVVEVMPSPPVRPPKPPAEDKNDRSVWKGLVVGADDFAPTPAKPKGGRTIVIAILVLAGLGGGAYVLWPKTAAKVTADATQSASPSPADVLPQDAAPVAPAAPDGGMGSIASPALPGAAAAPDGGADGSAVVIDAGTPDAGVTKKPVKRKYFRPPPSKRSIKRTH